jgi:hypothetical protein
MAGQLMGYVDPDVRREYARVWASDRRAAWLEDHPCACGRPAKHTRAAPGQRRVPRVWTWAPARRDLALVGVRTFCDRCEPPAYRERKSLVLGTRTETGIVVKCEDAPQVKRRAPKRSKERKIDALAPLPFQRGPIEYKRTHHDCDRCDDSFDSRIELIVHRRQIHGVLMMVRT